MKLVNWKILAAIPLAVFLVGCDFFHPTIRGYGKSVSEVRPVSNFQEIELTGAGNVRVTVGEKESLTLQADENLLEYLTTEVSGTRLLLGSRNCFSLSPTREVTYRVVVKDLTRVALSGSGDISLLALTNEKLSIDLNGSGTVTVSGSSGLLDGDISGSGYIDTADLKTQSATVGISGSGNATVWTTKSLSAKISGSGRVDYYGRPELSQSITGSGSVRSLGTK